MYKPSRVNTILSHTALWLVLAASLWLGRTTQLQSWHPTPAVWQLILMGLLFVVVFYLHAYWLIPVYFSRKKKVLYVIFTLALLGITSIWPTIVVYLFSPPPPGIHYFPIRPFPVLFFLLASASLGISRENVKLEKKQKEKETEHLRTELSFLRTQVNPHFMLNVLNSMALLARKKSDLLEPVLMELARLMNYMLYDANNEKIVLADEIGYLRA